ncbi:MAG: FMN-binding protein [Candidatus Cloacimonadaceae bacterium]
MSEAGSGILENKFYPIIFMLVLTVVFVGILSAFFRTSEFGIEEFKQQTYRLQILSLFADTLNVLTGIEKSELTNPELVQENFDKYIQELKLPSDKLKTISSKYYSASTMQDNILGYCYDISGSGLWGTMRGLIAVTPDFSRIINFAIYDQMETPGLGSRVTEEWFKTQFAGKPLIADSTVADFALVQEEAESSEYEIKQVTGATITSAAVLKIITSAANELKDLAQNIPSESDD